MTGSPLLPFDASLLLSAALFHLANVICYIFCERLNAMLVFFRGLATSPAQNIVKTSLAIF